MVGPPSSWSLWDQEGGVDRLDPWMRIYRLSCPAGTVSLRPSDRFGLPANSPPVPPASTSDLQLDSNGDLRSAAREFLCGPLHFGGDMLFKIALALLAVWLLGVLGLYTIGDLVPVLLLVGLGLLLLAFLRARDAAAKRVVSGPSEKP
jgi:hypothetical protein